MFFRVNIGPADQFSFLITQIQCPGGIEIVEIWRKLHKYEEILQYFSPIFDSIYIVVYCIF